MPTRIIQLSGTIRFKDESGALFEFPISKREPLEVPFQVYEVIQDYFVNKTKRNPAGMPPLEQAMPQVEPEHQMASPFN
jgi:hypothetical protein